MIYSTSQYIIIHPQSYFLTFVQNVLLADICLHGSALNAFVRGPTRAAV